MSSLTTAAPARLTSDDIDDLIYACRTDDLEYLKSAIPKHADQLECTAADIIKSAIDVDEEGLGSRACLLHYPAANGKLGMIEYLLETLAPQPAEPQVNGGGAGAQSRSQSMLLVNHQNVSGNTPLHWAALNGHIEIVKALVKAGADPTVVNEAGRDAVVEAEYSSQAGAEECATWLLRECEALERGAGGVLDGEGEPSAGVEGGEVVQEDGEEKARDERAGKP
ncbi:ankyrin repeat-containing protein [Exophiala xenobiotica]|uniref:Ankyrin repeat-containing protein n=1 Tax=Lithohypha guttulata TaxID=1690604 RepID=A0ABR0KHD0_9EURO|nr:ankyrin repeat-containing protein [Lithohypha guttulata]KAK5323850.1 ankyrin repeat-containing protein [Exophiala xenobiotica]